MAVTKLTTDLNIIQSLVDEPNDVGGLTASEVKAKFDEAGNIIKTYVNDVLTPSIDSLNTSQSNGLIAHKSSSDHDGRYYTEAEINALLLDKTNLIGDHMGTWKGHELVETDPGIQVIVNDHTLKLAEVTYKSKNLMDYSSDLLTAFNMAMADTTHNSFHLLDGTHITTGSMIFARGKKLQLNKDTVIKTTNFNTPIFVMNRESELRGGTIDMDYVAPDNLRYTSSAILFDGDNFDCETACVDDIKIYGNYGVGSKGIEIRANVDASHYVMYCRVTNIYIHDFADGIYSSATNGGFCNGNVFSGRIFGGTNQIYLVGGTSGNNFDMMMQAGYKVNNITEAYGIYCEGSFNVFNGFIWDIAEIYTNNYCYFTSKSTGNHMLTRIYNMDGVFSQVTIRDEGSRNIIGNLIPFQNSFIPPTTSVRAGGGSVAMTGQQDDMFAFLHKNTSKYTIGKSFFGCNEANTVDNKPEFMFEPNNKANLINVTGALDTSYLVYTITFTNKEQLLNLGIGFGSGVAKANLRLYNDALLVAEKTIPCRTKDISFNTVSNWNITMEYDGVNDNNLKNINKVVITLSEPVSNIISIFSIFASCTNGGNTFVNKYGGEMYDDITYAMSKGTVLRTPDGTKKYRLGVSDAGALTFTLVP